MNYNIFCRFSSKYYIFINKYFRHENCSSFDLLMYVHVHVIVYFFLIRNEVQFSLVTPYVAFSYNSKITPYHYKSID